MSNSSPPWGKEVHLITYNPYSRQLTPDEIAAGEHRAAVGGLWDELGRLQCDFMISAGLLPDHQFIDVGCGACSAAAFISSNTSLAAIITAWMSISH